MRFPILFDRWYGVLSRALGLPPSDSYVEIDAGRVRARMGWAFRADFPRATIVNASESRGFTLSRGVHGFAGRWLVNGSGRGILGIDLEPAQGARVLGVPVSLRRLLVSVADPAALARALTAP